jgi:general secretion pathway protein A
VDEAQTIQDKVVFDDLRMLLNFQLNERYLLTLILLGQFGLKELMAQQRGLDQRLAIRLHLDHLSPAETAFYIAFRLEAAGSTTRIFTDTAIQAIHQESQGIPRRINNLCDLCLFEGMRAQVQEVESALVKVILAFT